MCRTPVPGITPQRLHSSLLSQSSKARNDSAPFLLTSIQNFILFLLPCYPTRLPEIRIAIFIFVVRVSVAPHVSYRCPIALFSKDQYSSFIKFFKTSFKHFDFSVG